MKIYLFAKIFMDSVLALSYVCFSDRNYTQKKKFSQYRHCVQEFCKTVLILTKNLTQNKIHVMSYKCEYF